ncbi:MAG TPA: NAD-dependent epimerase/dehydratase family protein [Ignavibacteriaceae bacterium]|nr:NAD-dependent epimerase/dehydratase family protein [Ignavibacteriaceae bacterium]
MKLGHYQKKRIEINTISILGCGWLGLPLAVNFINRGYNVKASTTSGNRLAELSAQKIEPYIIELENLPGNISAFLKSDTLIINIPSKNINGFRNLVKEIEKSGIEKVIFVGSTSIYEDNNKTIYEDDGEESSTSPFFSIENLLLNSGKFRTTILRFGGLIGYSRNPGRFFANGRPVANPEANINMIHRDDCIEIIDQIIEQSVWGEVFNCCADTHPTKRKFYTLAAKNIDAQVPNFEESADKKYKIISNEKIKKFLNYEFKYPDLMKINFS